MCDEVSNSSGVHYELTNSIDASETSEWDSGGGFVPIGDSSNNFKGNFLGRGHVVSNLCVNRPSSSVAGLFASATIQGLGVVNADITGDDDCTGALAGMM